MKRGIIALVAATISVAIISPPSQALTLKIAPLSYQASLEQGEKQKGFVDIANPGAIPVVVKLHVQAFRQINDAGELEFYDNQQVSAGVQLDLNEVELGAHESLHLAFLLDGSKLPQGDVFAAILGTALISGGQGGATQSVQVGTLISATNGTPLGHEAVITRFDTPFLQIGDNVDANITVKNTADPKRYTGFYPTISYEIWPFAKENVQGPLIFAGRSRDITLRQSGNYIGFVSVNVAAENNHQRKIIFVITGYWRWLSLLTLVALLAGSSLFYRHRNRRAKNT